MKISRTKARSRLAAKLLKGSPAIRFMRQVGEGLMAFRQDKRAVLTTSDDELPAIIGECDAEGLESIPPSMAAWLEETAREVADYQAKPKPRGIVKVKAATSDTEPQKGRISVKPLIKAVWGQSSPYNQNLKFGGKLSYVGCNAVAMSMLMLYWHEQGYDRGCLPTKGYTSKTNGYKIPSLPPLTIFDYGKMTEGKPATDAQKAAVAGLCQHIGYALKSDYTPNGTLAYMGDCVTVFKTYLRFGNPKRIYANKGYDAFERQIYEELAAGRPVIMAGYTVNGAGHCFLCDGYNAARDMYHINWGWNGQCNGYFRMSALDATSARAYDSNKVAIIGICPTYKLGDVNGDGEVTITDAMKVVELAAQGSTDPKADINSDGKVTTADVNSDGKVTAADANVIVEHIMGGKKL